MSADETTFVSVKPSDVLLVRTANASDVLRRALATLRDQLGLRQVVIVPNDVKLVALREVTGAQVFALANIWTALPLLKQDEWHAVARDRGATTGQAEYIARGINDLRMGL